ncbi:hypothetical protein B0H14DRAFT_2690979 [Mycena olivaceomarginata]|nr:hypothetical protein B0H14DRAFT_2690979 [Mycena olivaceomarginata]
MRAPVCFRRLSISVSNAHRFGRLFEPLSCATFGSHVREIELDGSIICDFGRPRFSPSSSAFQVITHLELNYSALAPRITCTISPVAGFVSMFPRLEVLKLTQENGAYPDFGGLSEPRQPTTTTSTPSRSRQCGFSPSGLLRPTYKPPISAIRFGYFAFGVIKALESLRCLSTLSSPNRLDPTTQLCTLRIQADYSQAAHILLKLFSYIDTSCLAEVSLDFAIPYLDSPRPGWRSRINQRMLLPDAAHRMPLCHRGFRRWEGLRGGGPRFAARRVARRASRRWLSDLHAF